MIYVLLLAIVWSAVGALVYFVRANITFSQRLGLTVATSLAFGVIGWVDMSSIYHTASSSSAVIAKQLGQIESQQAKAAN